MDTPNYYVWPQLTGLGGGSPLGPFDTQPAAVQAARELLNKQPAIRSANICAGLGGEVMQTLTRTFHNYTMADVRAAVPLFFERKTMRGFRSRILDYLYCGMGGYFFVTSEQHSEQGPRLYSVRQFIPATMQDRAYIRTAGKFQGFTDRESARAQAKRYACGDDPLPH